MCRMAAFAPSEGRDPIELLKGLRALDKAQGGHGMGVAVFDGAWAPVITKGEKVTAEECVQLLVTRPLTAWAFWHCRLRSAGERNDAACHPFCVTSDKGNETVLMHNGTVSSWGVYQEIAGWEGAVSDSHFLAWIAAARSKELASRIIDHGALVVAERSTPDEAWKFHLYRSFRGDMYPTQGGGCVSMRVPGFDTGQSEVKGSVWHELQIDTPAPAWEASIELHGSSHGAPNPWTRNDPDYERWQQRWLAEDWERAEADTPSPPRAHYTSVAVGYYPNGNAREPIELVTVERMGKGLTHTEATFKLGDGRLIVLEDTNRKIGRTLKKFHKMTARERGSYLAGLLSRDSRNAASAVNPQ